MSAGLSARLVAEYETARRSVREGALGLAVLLPLAISLTALLTAVARHEGAVPWVVGCVCSLVHLWASTLLATRRLASAVRVLRRRRAVLREVVRYEQEEQQR